MHEISHPLDLLACLDSCDVFSFSGRESNDVLQLRRPGDRTSTHLDDIFPSRVTSILASTMVCIRESNKGLSLLGIRRIGYGVVQGALDIAQEVFDSEPMRPTMIGVEPSQYTNSIRNIWRSCGGKVHQSTNSREVRSLTHCGTFLVVLGALSAREAKSRFHGSRDRLTVCHTKSIQDVKEILPLREGDGVLRTIPVNLHTQELSSGPQITDFEVLA